METYTEEQPEYYDVLTQPGGLWLRILNDDKAAALLGKSDVQTWEYIACGILANAAKANGYIKNPDVNITVEHYNHAKNHTVSYAYIPIIKPD